jgi:hypothetical protein
MTLYARSDVMCLSLGAHGCGASHSREVTRGVAAREFRLDCPPCEAHLRGDRKPKKLVYETDKRTGQTIRQARVADSDPMWSSTPDVPQTPDEERINAVRQERGSQQIQMIQALAALRATGIQVPDEAMWLLERELPSGVLKGTMLCASGHDNPAGVKFCGECGMSMAARGAIASSDEPVVDLSRLHVATLRKRCRDAGLPDKGSKDALIGRLEAA